MVTKKSSSFDLKITSSKLADAVAYANRKVLEQYAASSGSRRGVIFAQIFVEDDGSLRRLRIKGDYFDPEAAQEIQKAINRRYTKVAKAAQHGS
jgi:hypothetical protein